MTRKDAVLAALAHEQQPVIPWHVDFTTQALQNLVDATDDAAIGEKTGAYLHAVQYWGWPQELPGQPLHFRDEFGVVWNRSGADRDIGVVDTPLIADIEDHTGTFPPCDTARLRRDLEALVATKGDRFTMMQFGFCMFERSWSLAGMENVLMAMVASPDALEELYDAILDRTLPLIDIAVEYDIDGVMFGDDWGQQRGLIMGAAHWRRFIKPRMAQLYARAKRAGKKVLQHSCGDCAEILPDLVEIGLDCYQTVQPEVYDLEAVKRQYGKNLSFWGGISTQQALPWMQPDALRAEIRRVAGILRPGGGYILAPTHAVPGDVPPENILAMLEVFQNQHRFL